MSLVNAGLRCSCDAVRNEILLKKDSYCGKCPQDVKKKGVVYNTVYDFEDKSFTFSLATAEEAFEHREYFRKLIETPEGKAEYDKVLREIDAKKID